MAEELALDTRAEADATPQKALRRWLLEIKLAQKREKDWRQKARAILDTYRGAKRKKNSFNILWANTEVMRPALYNSTPKPDVRRRFRQNDPLGKAVSEVAERSISYCVDAYDLDNCLQNDVLDALLPGRGVSRVRYVPTIKEVQAGKDEAEEGTREEVDYEQALCEHVQWDDFLHGAGKTWEEVQWVGFGHNLTRDEQIKKFGKKVAEKITLDDVQESEVNEEKNKDLQSAFKTSRFWEIWDKEGGKVFFVNESYREGVIYPVGEKGEPPLKLKNFFPCGRPLQLVEDTGTLVPIPLYELYREQAEELDRLSGRINKIINACRVRFAHDPTLTELATLMDAGDNVGIPVEQARAWMTNGGLDKAIWWMPVEQIAAVLKELYVARDGAKQVIYEITGLADILRGATNPNETLGAQKLKANSASLRLQRMQREVQRYTRDLIKLLGEVIGENFDPKTLAQMTGLQFPTNMQKQQGQMLLQAAQAQAQQNPQAQPDPKIQQVQQMLSMPSWEDIMGVLRSDMQREYRVDVETDSTVAQSLQQDMEGMREVYTSLVELWNGAGPAVASGALSIEVVKSMSLNIARRARMGLEVEDAIESGMQQPKPQDNGEGAKAEAEKAKQQAEVAKEQQKTQQEGQKLQAEAQSKQVEEQADLQREQIASQEKIALDAQQKAHDLEVARMELEKKYEFERWKVMEDNNAKIEVAEISAEASRDIADSKAEQAESEGVAGAPKKPKRKRPMDRLAEQMNGHFESHSQALQHLAGMHEEIKSHVKQMADDAASPAVFIRGQDGRVAAVQRGSRVMKVQRGPDGRAESVH